MKITSKNLKRIIKEEIISELVIDTGSESIPSGPEESIPAPDDKEVYVEVHCPVLDKTRRYAAVTEEFGHLKRGFKWEECQSVNYRVTIVQNLWDPEYQGEGNEPRCGFPVFIFDKQLTAAQNIKNARQANSYERRHIKKWMMHPSLPSLNIDDTDRWYTIVAESPIPAFVDITDAPKVNFMEFKLTVRPSREVYIDGYPGPAAGTWWGYHMCIPCEIPGAIDTVEIPEIPEIPDYEIGS